MLKKHWAALLLALIAGGIFSLRWSYPVISEWSAGTQPDFVPVRYGTSGYGDDYFYYTFVRSFLSKPGFASDPISYEHRDEVTPHVSYTVSLWLASIGGFFTKNTDHAYAFNFFVYPAVTVGLIYLLFYSLTRARWLSAFFAFRSIFIFSEMERTPNILITNIFLTILVYLFFRLLELDDRHRAPALIPFFIGILPGTSMENAIIGAGWSIVLALAYGRQIGVKRLAFIAGGSIVIASPFLWLWIRSAPGQAILLEYGNLYMESQHAFYLREFVAEVVKLGVPLLWMSLFDFRHRKFVMLIQGTLLLMYVAASPLLGSFGARHVVFRGAELIAYTTTYASLILIFQELVSKRSLTVGRNVRTVFRAVLAIVIVGYATVRFQQHLAAAAELSQRGRDRQFYELAHWSAATSSPSDVYITLDPDLLLNLSVYSPARAYLPQALLSYVFTPERSLRLFDILKLYNVSPDRLPGLFPSTNASNPSGPERQKYLFAMVMYYLKYAEVEDLASYSVVRDLQNDYRAEAGEQPCTRYVATQLIVSPFDEKLLSSDSVATRLIRSHKPLFDNGRYKVFHLDSSVPSCSSVQP